MIKVLIAEDHCAVRRGLRQILEEAPEISVCGEAITSEEVLKLVAAKAWDLLVLDITLSGRSGLQILHELRQLNPKLPILVLSMNVGEQIASRVRQAGAAGFLPKETALEMLVKAIRKVCARSRRKKGRGKPVPS